MNKKTKESEFDLDWEFFRDEKNKIVFHPLCQKCQHDKCKQSFRTEFYYGYCKRFVPKQSACKQTKNLEQ